MKLAGRAAREYFARPDPDKAGLLIYGDDAMRVALKRQEVIAALAGPNAGDEMRLTRLMGADLRRDPAQLTDAMRATGFFPGPRVVFVEQASDAAAPAVAAALEDWRAGDAVLVVAAGSLPARSALRKAFEAHRDAYAVGIYDDPPDAAEIEATLDAAGLTELTREVMTDLTALAQVLDPGDFAQAIEKLALYKLGDHTPVDAQDIAAIAPLSTEAALDDVFHLVAEARASDVGPVLRRLAAQGVQPVGLCIAATRHFRALHAAASDPGGASTGMARLRPPVFGPRRDRMTRQAQSWGTRSLERALALLIDTDLTLRSTSRAPAMAVIERTMIRLAMMGAR